MSPIERTCCDCEEDDVADCLTDGYLWAVAKDDPVLRKVPRMVERNTIMY